MVGYICIYNKEFFFYEGDKLILIIYEFKIVIRFIELIFYKRFCNVLIKLFGFYWGYICKCKCLKYYLL